ncbi:DUF262 domain-containing protein [Longispora sp. K20-0274]|uniref:DUF262 domain-containing protein n=1 Tax=Longispora sp. K20-0274 TaxID=3088255 RepID=UPI00399A40B3
MRPSTSRLTMRHLLDAAADQRLVPAWTSDDQPWTAEEGLRLIDSIGRGWPIGTLIVYGPYPEEGLVLDGRHRLATIAAALHAPLAGDPRPDCGDEMFWDLTDTTGQATRHSPTITGRPSSWWPVRTLTSTLALLTHGRTLAADDQHLVEQAQHLGGMVLETRVPVLHLPTRMPADTVTTIASRLAGRPVTIPARSHPGA